MLNRRDVVDIRKQKIIVRSGKFVKKNWISAVATVLLAILSAYLFVLDFDDNPASLTAGGSVLYVKNKNGKVLWTKKIMLSDDESGNQNLIKDYCRIYDVDEDGANEVLLTNEINSDEKNNSGSPQLICYSKQNKKLWSYTFTDSVEAEREVLKPYYSIFLVDTLTIDRIKNLFLISSNLSSFSSAIYRIDIRTGKRLQGTIWCSGHTSDAIIKDVNNDRRKDILAIGFDNGFENQVLFSFTIDSLTKVRPSTKNYTIKNYTPAELISYIRIPKTDFSKYNNIRISGIGRGSLSDEIFEDLYRFILMVTQQIEDGSFWVKLNYNLKDIDFIISNQFRVNRDSLVAQGKLNPPYTDSKENIEILKNNVLYWKPDSLSPDKWKWVKREELD